MTPTDCTIESLMKVSLNLREKAAADAEAPEIAFEFIYGVGPGGITPFEKALFGKRRGDRIDLTLPPGDTCQMLGHLELPLREQTGIAAPAALEAVVTRVVRAGDREVVKAMASGGSCSDCGCGCGGH